MKEEDARAAADAVGRGEHPNQEGGDEDLLAAIAFGEPSARAATGTDDDADTGPAQGPVGRLRRFLENLFAGL